MAVITCAIACSLRFNCEDGEYLRESREKTMVISCKYICVLASFILNYDDYDYLLLLLLLLFRRCHSCLSLPNLLNEMCSFSLTIVKMKASSSS